MDSTSKDVIIPCGTTYLAGQEHALRDERRIGILGICAGGGYAVHAAITDHRLPSGDQQSADNHPLNVGLTT